MKPQIVFGFLLVSAVVFAAPAAPGSASDVSIPTVRDQFIQASDGFAIRMDVGATGTPVGRVLPTLSFTTGVCSQCVHSAGVVTVALEVSQLTDPINGVQVLFRYDPAMLSLSSLTPGDGLGSPWDVAGTVFFDDTAGDVTAAWVLLGGQTVSDATVATATFTVGLGTTSVDFRPANPPFLTKLTTAAANGTVLPVEVGSPDIHVGQTAKGDVNGDGLRDAADIQAFVDVVLSPGSATPAELCAADMDGDGTADPDLDGPSFVTFLLTGACSCP